MSTGEIVGKTAVALTLRFFPSVQLEVLFLVCSPFIQFRIGVSSLSLAFGL